jgi:hypothetical protein
MVTQTFNNVWYLPDENTWEEFNLMAYRDVGRLIIGEDSLEFQGKKERIVITGVRRVSYGKQGRDFINNWAKIEYGDPATVSTVYFADGSLLGWGGIFGGTKKIYTALQHLSE